MKIIKSIGYLAALSLMISLYGCGASEEDQVIEGIKKEVSNKFSMFLVDPDVEIKAFESNGSSVAPEYKARFVVTMKFFEPMYERVSTMSSDGHEWTVVRQKHPKGGDFKLFGSSTSRLKNEEIVTSLDNLERGDEEAGWKLSSFSGGVVEGSDEHKSIIERVKKLEELKAGKINEMRDKLVGNWTGTYTCSELVSSYEQKHTDYKFSLNITSVVSDSDGFATMIAEFADVQEPLPHSYVLKGALTEAGSFDTKPAGWINRVGTQEWAGFKGGIDKGSEKITGDVKYHNCSSFQLRRSS